MREYLWENTGEDVTFALDALSSAFPYADTDHHVRKINVQKSQTANEIFFTRTDGARMDGDEQHRRLDLFRDASCETDMIFKLLRRLDQVNEMTRLQFQKEWFYEHLKNGSYGEQAYEWFQQLDPKAQDVLLYYLVYQYHDDRHGLLERAVRDLFSEVVVYEDTFTQEFLVFTVNSGTKANEVAWKLLCFFFQPLFTKVRIVWDTRPFCWARAGSCKPLRRL